MGQTEIVGVWEENGRGGNCGVSEQDERWKVRTRDQDAVWGFTRASGGVAYNLTHGGGYGVVRIEGGVMGGTLG